MSGAPDASRFAIERAEVREGLELAFIREGPGGYPLLLVHGWPETKRIWWRNIAALAQAGFEVIAPDLRGFGDSALAPDGFYDLAAHAPRHRDQQTQRRQRDGGIVAHADPQEDQREAGTTRPPPSAQREHGSGEQIPDNG